jgi:hypothetical protein
LILKPIQPLGTEPSSSAPDAIHRAIQPRGDINVRHPLSRKQDHPRPLHRPERQRDRARPPLKLNALLGGELDHIRTDPGHNT